MRTARIKLDRILMPRPVAAGMNYLVVASLSHMLRSSTADAPPITLRRTGRYYRIIDGRHRFVAAHIAGRQRILAHIEDTPTPNPPAQPG